MSDIDALHQKENEIARLTTENLKLRACIRADRREIERLQDQLGIALSSHHQSPQAGEVPHD